jgi:hypothetical protein
MQSDNTFTLRAAAAASAFRRVTVNASGQSAVADNTVKGVGVLQRDVSAETWDAATIRTWGAGTHAVAVTGAPITAGDLAYAAAGGLVAATGTVIVGRCITGTTVNSTIIEIAQS